METFVATAVGRRTSISFRSDRVALDDALSFFFNGRMFPSGVRPKLDAVLAPSREPGAPWRSATLGRWETSAGVYSMEQFFFAGPRGGGEPFRVGIFAGIHGDETAGVFATVRFLRELAENPGIARGYELYLHPLCNPTGFEDGTRHARSGRDLNREFWLGSREPEVMLLEQQIRTLRFDGLISLHADDESPGLYAFALGALVTHDVVEPALAAAEKILPVNRERTIDNFVARNGLIRKGYPGMLCAAPEAHPRPFEIVFETPREADLERQIEANLVFLRHALEQYQELRAVGQDL
jgi:protein MpaA